MKKYHYTIEIADSPEWPVKTPRQAYQRLRELGKQGRLGECVVEAKTFEEADWRTALKPKSKKT